MNRKILFLTVLFYAAMCVGVAPKPDVSPLLDAIRQVETGGRDIDGDGGKAIGPYQIHEAYWKDSRVPGKYADCHDDAYSRRVILAYWQRYCPAGDFEALARTHNGGPNGPKIKATLAYWVKVQAAMKGNKNGRG